MPQRAAVRANGESARVSRRNHGSTADTRRSPHRGTPTTLRSGCASKLRATNSPSERKPRAPIMHIMSREPACPVGCEYDIWRDSPCLLRMFVWAPVLGSHVVGHVRDGAKLAELRTTSAPIQASASVPITCTSRWAWLPTSTSITARSAAVRTDLLPSGDAVNPSRPVCVSNLPSLFSNSLSATAPRR